MKKQIEKNETRTKKCPECKGSGRIPYGKYKPLTKEENKELAKKLYDLGD
jgi:hypothetical protein